MEFETFYHGSAPRLLRYAYGLTGDGAEAQDFTQEAFARAWQRWSRVSRYDDPEAWLRLVVNRLATDRWRRLGVRKAWAAKQTHWVPNENDGLIDLVAELKRLPVAQRKAMALHYLLDMPVADIAAETGVSVNTVKSWLARGRARLAERLSTPDTLAPVATLAARARQRTRNMLASIIAAISATAAASFLLVPVKPVPPVQPPPVIGYGAHPERTIVQIVGSRAYTLWATDGGETWLGAIDMDTGRQAWPVRSLGKADDRFLDTKTPILLVSLYPTTGDRRLLAIDPETGKTLWEKVSSYSGSTFSNAFVQREDGRLTSYDIRTGDPMWTVDSSVGNFPAYDPETKVFFEADPSGVVRTRDAATGAVIRQRPVSGLHTGPWLTVIGGWLYLVHFGGTEAGVYRSPVGGTEPFVRVAGPAPAGASIASIKPCGKLLCLRYELAGEDGVVSQSALALIDPVTGSSVKRLDGLSIETQNAAFGWSMSEHGVVVVSGSPQPHRVVLDANGNDVTPQGLRDASAAVFGAEWIDRDRLLITESGNPAGSMMTVYSVHDGTSKPIGQTVLRGQCASAAGKVICPGTDGFMLYEL